MYVYVEPCKSLARSDAYFTSESEVKSQFGIAKTGSSEWAEQQKTFPWLADLSSELSTEPLSATFCWILPKDEPEDDPKTETILNVLEFEDVATAAEEAPYITDGDPYSIGDQATINAGDGWAAGAVRVDRVVLVVSLWDEKFNAVAATATVKSMLSDLVPTVLP
ncbi:hypothetical protein ACIRON_00355 [Nocardioides sp. NPDC101246]|uniref:hypothetical protein n=1 Tax=Nocardioides sp. NPDC101246 TaxID=3364336 RepID=UPI0038227182